MESQELMSMLAKCSVITPIHVFKMSREQSYAHLHFDNHADASCFYHIYKDGTHTLCDKINNLVVKPSRVQGIDVQYEQAYQTRLDENQQGWCQCTVPAAAVPVPESQQELKRKIADLIEEIKREEDALQAASGRPGEPSKINDSSRSFAHVHFANEEDAANFYNRRAIGKRLTEAIVSPSCGNGMDVNYDNSLYQQRIDGGLNKTWCNCTVPTAVHIAVPADAPVVPADAPVVVPDLKRKIKELTDEIKRDENALQVKRQKLMQRLEEC